MSQISDFPSEYQAFIHKSRYARWLPEETRRESWTETVGRYLDYMAQWTKAKHDVDLTPYLPSIESKILNLEVMPSMRALMTAGKALDNNHIAAYNCSYLSIDSLESFGELLYILMHGTGVGFSVERQFIKSLPAVPEHLFEDSHTTIKVSDSKEGWYIAYIDLLNFLYQGIIPNFDVSEVRPAGALLKTFGGRASGPDPLLDLFNFTIAIFVNAAGRKLTSIECHDLCCKIGEIVVVGGVRRSALISLSNLSDLRMRDAKAGNWYDDDQFPWRQLANNSVCYTEKPEMGIFMDEWKSLYESKSGERGIFNREAAQMQANKFFRRDPEREYGTNPCSEIILRSMQFCNLTEVVVRRDDTVESLQDKVEIATILGTLQSTLTDIRNLRIDWNNNTEEERLLGVSLTGIMDNPYMSNRKQGQTSLINALQTLRTHARKTNHKWAHKLKIPKSAAITCVKPSGTVSQLVNSASGIHPRHSEYYIRTVRADIKDPLTRFMQESGVPNEPCAFKPHSQVVFSFPIKSPEDAVCRKDLTAIEHLELWNMYQENWCEHKPSVTISVRENEWLDVGAWVWKHFSSVSGISFLPYSDHVYRQAPYQECNAAKYQQAVETMPDKIDWARAAEFENEDNTRGNKTLACSGDTCEFVDLTDGDK